MQFKHRLSEERGFGGEFEGDKQAIQLHSQKTEVTSPDAPTRRDGSSLSPAVAATASRQTAGVGIVQQFILHTLKFIFF